MLYHSSGGLYDEDVSREQLEPWREHTFASFSLKMLPGDHFFLHSSESMVLQILALELEAVLSGLNQRHVRPRAPTFQLVSLDQHILAAG